MRHVFLVAILCFIATPIAQAQDAASKSTSNAPHLPGRVQLVEDNENGMLRILFDGLEVARCRASAQKHIDCEVIAGDAVILPVVNEPAPLPAATGDGAP